MAERIPDVRGIFDHAVELSSAVERDEFLSHACGGDAELLRKVERLLHAHEAAGSFMQSPASNQAATVDQVIVEGPGTAIGPYKLLEQIGEGGFGIVFMAEQQRPMHRRVALKLLKPGMDTRQVVARFEAERQALALMDHPNIARVFDAGATESGRPYFVMELVRGISITDFCDRNHFPVRERLELFITVCRAVQHAHQKGIIHRDIKPTNVLVTLHDGAPVAKVIDFGIAKATVQPLTEKTLFTNYAQIIGTPLYMSPEQAEMSGLDVDTRTDIYSLGVLLYELLTGTTPFDKERLRTAGLDEIRRIIREEEPARPSTRLSTLGQAAATMSANRGSEPHKLSSLFRGELDWIAMKALEKDRNRRYETASALAADVQRYLADQPVQACPPSTWYRFRKFARRNKRAVVTATAATLVLLMAVAGLATTTLLIAREEKVTKDALAKANQAKDDLDSNLKHERQETYYRSISLGYRELSADNLRRAVELLDECPEELREWEWRYLMRLCRVEPRVIRDKSGVTSVAFSPGGERIASTGTDGSVKVWSSFSGEVLKTIPNAHSRFASSVAFHPGGQYLASVGEDRLVKVWDLSTDSMVFESPCDAEHTFGNAYAAAFSPLDPDQLAVGSEGAVTLWDWRTKKLIHTYPRHETPRISLAYSRDGRHLASGNWGGSVKLWNPEARGEPLRSFPEARYPITALSFNRDASRLASANFDRRVDVWDTATGGRVHQLPHRGLVLCAAFSPDGRLVVSAGEDKAVHVWDAQSGRELLSLRGHTNWCGCVAFSPNGERLASASMDGTIRVWDATPLRRDERQEARSITEHDFEVWSLAVSPKGDRIASTGHGTLAKVRDTETHNVTAEFRGYRNVDFCAAWHPDGERIASAGGNGDQFSVTVWNARSGQEVFSLPVGPEYFAVAFSIDGQYMVTGGVRKPVQVWDARDGKPIGKLGTHLGGTRAVVISPDRRHLATAGTDGVVNLWDAARLGEREPQQPLRTFTVHVPGPGVNVAFSPDGKRIAIGDKDYTVVIWDVDTGNELKTLRGHLGDVYAVAFSPDGRWVASAGEDSTVKVWDSRTGKLIRTFRGHTGLVGCLAFSRDGRSLISGSRDRTVKFWDVTQLEVVPER